MKTNLYIHIPFCEHKCSFCSFPVCAGQMGRRDEYLSALEREARLYSGAAIKQEIASVYIGGGTPSSLEPEQILRLREIIDRHFKIRTGAEISFEVNPENVDEAKVWALRRAGYNRISLGVQSLQDDRLKSLGRIHDGRRAREAFRLLRRVGFGNISVDLMYGMPGQGLEELERDIDAVLGLGAEHMSLYAFSIEERSLLHVRGMKVDSETQADYYERVRLRLKTAGLTQYEVSNFSRSGFESKHNINYWRGGEYIGLGMGAHSHLDGRRWWNHDSLFTYLQAIETNGQAEAGSERLELFDQMVETLLFGLRMNDGVDIGELSRRYGRELPEEKSELIDAMIGYGLLEDSGLVLRATDRGRLVLDEISARLV